MVKHGVILAGGNGTRLKPLTQVINKSLLGVNGKFIIDYPLNTLKQMGIENCTVVLGGNHYAQVVSHLKDGKDHGMNFSFLYQGDPTGISAAINLCKNSVGQDNFAVILGDNYFENPITWTNKSGAQIVLDTNKCNDEDIKRFGIATIDKQSNIIKIEEKPKTLNIKYRNYPITGCYLFDQQFFEFFKETKPSDRQEYEITDIIYKYQLAGKLTCTQTDKNSLWSDLGTHESIAYVNNYLYNIERKVLI